MSDTGSALAINEKKTQRTGGCVGIFFQLFDWKKRLAKKKFFPNKLLSLDSGQHGSKRFGADDKLPKLRLKSNEKNVDPGQKHAMRTPTLVARLMGLDSLPAVRDKIKKISSDKIDVDRGDKFASDRCQFNGQHIKFEKEGSKRELKPHKLQKTGFSERRAVARFGGEGLHFKNVLSRSSKHHHPNFAPPMKSPKRLSKRNAARLIGAATRILEPGLQSRNRAKWALPYSSQENNNPADGVLVEEGTALSKDRLESSAYYENATRFSKGQSSCENCGNIVDIPESGTYLEEQPSISEYMGSPLSELERCTRRSPISSLGTKKESVFHRSPEKFTAFAVQSLGNVDSRAKHTLKRATFHKVSQTQWQQPSKQYRKEEISLSSICYKQKFSGSNQGVKGRDRTSRRSTYTGHLSREVPLNQSSTDHKCSRVPAKLDKCGYVLKGRSTDRLYDPLSSARKRRWVDLARQDDICTSVGSTIDRQRNLNCNARGLTLVRGNVQSAKLACISSNLPSLGNINKTCDTNDGVNSFTFSSSKKHKDITPVKATDREYQNEFACSSSQESSVLDKINRNEKVCFQKSSPSTVDTLGVLEQKLKEIRSQGDNEMARGGYPLKLTPAIILQELISALSSERSLHANDFISGPTETSVFSFCDHTLSAHPSFQAQLKKEAAQVRHLNDSNKNGMCPLSVLEASVSNGSFLSSSLDDGLVHKPQTDVKDLYPNEQQLKPSVDLLHGTTSISKGRPGIELIADFVNSITDVLCSMDLVDSRLIGSKLADAEEVILNAELVFGNPFQHNSNESKGFSICQFIVNELETLGSVLWTNFGCFSESEDTEGNLLKGFLFDCVIEYLDSRYIRSIKGRIKSGTDLPVSMNTEMLIREVVEEIRRWTSWAGFVLDEQIAREMSRWSDFDVEALETSVAIDGAILHSLVDEFVLELWQSKPKSRNILVKVVNGALECLSRDLGIAENTALQGWIVSTLLAGATVGSFTGGSMTDKFGRTKTFQLDAIPLAVGTLLCATAQSVQTMIIGRLLAGIGIGISSAIVPLYISEISPTEIRGTLGSVNQISICVGILAALVAGLPLAANPFWWRIMFGIAAIPSVLLALGMTISPESPRWLYQRGKISEAEIAVKRLYGKERVTKVMNNLTDESQGSSEPEAGWFDLFSSRYWKVVNVGAALFLFQQLAGINAVVYYSTPVFRSAGIASDVAASALVGASNVIGSTVASSLMDKQGRKSLLITSFMGMAASMFLLSLSFSWKVLALYSGTLAVVGTVLYVLSFSLGAGPVPALLLPEILK